MKRFQILSPLALMLTLTAGLAGVTAPQVQAAMPANLPATSPINSGHHWKNPQELYNRLTFELSRRLMGSPMQQIELIQKHAGTRLLLLNWQLARLETLAEKDYEQRRKTQREQLDRLRKEASRLSQEITTRTGAQKESAQAKLERTQKRITAIEAEAAYPLTLREVLQDAAAEELMDRICRDTDWLNKILNTGECTRPGRVIHLLLQMEKRNPLLKQPGMGRDIATATALEFARYDWDTARAVERADYFANHWKAGKLHNGFGGLTFFQRRIVCGWKGDHSSGSAKAMNWALENVRVPANIHTGSCWRCGYVLNNVYGDSIHGPYYGNAFEGMYEDHHMLFTREVGGVCGGLSHFGAACAVANGIPAMTAGEPGHCAYIVLVNGKWTPAYSLSWERGLHWQPWAGIYTYSPLHLTTELYSAEQAEQTARSNAARALAQLRLNRRHFIPGTALYAEAAKAQPLNYPVWREQIDMLKDFQPKQTQAWLDFNKKLCDNLVPRYPEVAAGLLLTRFYPAMKDCPMDDKTKMQLFTDFWNKVDGMGPDRWRVEQLADAQLQLLNCPNGKQGEERTRQFYHTLLTCTASREAYLPIVLGWGNKAAEKMSDEGKSRMLDTASQAIAASNAISPETRLQMLQNVLLSAEKMQDHAAFSSINKLITPDMKKRDFKMPTNIPTYPGKLVSEGAVPFASSTSRWDKVHLHQGLLQAEGGSIHTGRDTDAWLALKLAKHATINGVVIVNASDSRIRHRLNNLRVQVSETGKPDDWQDVGQPILKAEGAILQFDLQSIKPRALYIRILRQGGPEFMNLNGFYVYGTPAA